MRRNECPRRRRQRPCGRVDHQVDAGTAASEKSHALPSATIVMMQQVNRRPGRAAGWCGIVIAE